VTIEPGTSGTELLVSVVGHLPLAPSGALRGAVVPPMNEYGSTV
jgi:hypothetical protein